MPKLSTPQSRRQVPEADTRSVEEVILHRRLAQLRGEAGQFHSFSSQLPEEVRIIRCSPSIPDVHLINFALKSEIREEN